MTDTPLRFPRSTDGARELTYAHIKEKILNNEYGPNTQILQETIAAELGFSRTPIREAIVRLEQENLVKIIPRHGIEILAMKPSDMREIYEMLACLEPKAVEILARRKPSIDEIAELAGACDDMETALETDDRKAWAKADAAFHKSLAQLCGNSRLFATIMGFWEQSQRARMFTLMLRPKPEASTREHRAVLDAVLAGDADRAAALYKAHRERAQQVILQIIEEHGLKRL